MKKTKFKKNNKQKGFVMLFAVLISTLVLAVGISMISIALKQVQLSGSGRDSQYAFYVANTGAECATYWDLASSTIFTSGALPNPGTDIKCLGNPVAAKWPVGSPAVIEAVNACLGGGLTTDLDWCRDFSNPYVLKTKFRISYSDKPYCADVIVTKEIFNSGPSDGLVGTTTVTSRGYNTCDSTNPRRIERALQFSY